MSNYTNNTTKTSLVDNYKINEYRILKELAISERSSFEKFPLFIQIETTSKCNSNCVMCPRSKTPPKRKRSNMGNSLKKKILSELINHRDHIRRVIPQGYGEPLLDIKLPEFIKKLKDIGIKEVFISTNGSALTKDMAKKILDSGIDQVDFSVDGITEKTYNSIRKGLKFSTVVKNIEQFIQIRNQKQSHTSIRLRYVIQQGNRHEYEPFVKFWQHRIGKNDSVYAKKLHTFGGHIDMPNTEYYINLQKALCIQPCKGIFGTMAILSDGFVPVCGVDVNITDLAGDANINSLQQIWQGDIFRHFREQHLIYGRNAYEKCINCNTWAPELKLSENTGLKFS